GLFEDIAIGNFFTAFAAVEIQVVDIVEALHIHGKPLQTIGQFAGNRRAFYSRDLLKIGELRNLHAVAPAFPAKPPGAERRALPIVLDEANIVEAEIDADSFERGQIKRLKILRRRFQDDLELIEMLQPVRVLAIAPVLGPARGLHISGLPGAWPERAQRRRRVK